VFHWACLPSSWTAWVSSYIVCSEFDSRSTHSLQGAHKNTKSRCIFPFRGTSGRCPYIVCIVGRFRFMQKLIERKWPRGLSEILSRNFPGRGKECHKKTPVTIAFLTEIQTERRALPLCQHALWNQLQPLSIFNHEKIKKVKLSL
jgi:hypothetical protein